MINITKGALKFFVGKVKSICFHEYEEIADSGGDPPARFYRCSKCPATKIERPKHYRNCNCD